jgi:3-keto-5-aminohexanoate cleavage enzyme
MKKLIINLVPTGMVPTKKMTPYVPITSEEIVSDVLKCSGLGASMVHLHARKADGAPAYKKEIYAEIIAGIRAVNPDLVIVASTSGRTFNDFEKRADVLDLEGKLKPDMASLTLGSVNFSRELSLNSPETIIRLIERMDSRGIKPELEIFDLGMVNYAHYLISKGLIRPPYYFNILLGNIAGAQAKLLHLGLIADELPDESYWSVAGLGNCSLRVSAAGIIFGNGVRIGIEDTIWFDEARTILATNSTLVERVVHLASILEREIASPADVRQMLQL